MAIPNIFITAAARLLKPGGFFAIEHHENQADAIAASLANDFTAIRLHQDLTERPRFTTALRK
jgi:release factor glutamine methyltransferase